MIKIGVIHATCSAVEPLNKAAAKYSEDVKLLNFVNENLLFRANQVGGADEKGLRSFTRLLFEAVDADVDGVIVACSVYTPFVEQMKRFVDIPIIGIDKPMLVSAVKSGTKIGIIATTAASGPSAQHQMEKIAQQFSKEINFEMEIDVEAMTELKSGNTDVHNRRIFEAGKRLVDKGCDCIVLAQITMASAAEYMQTLGVPVLTSPDEGIKNIVAMIKN